MKKTGITPKMIYPRRLKNKIIQFRKYEKTGNWAISLALCMLCIDLMKFDNQTKKPFYSASMEIGRLYISVGTRMDCWNINFEK